MKIVLDASAVLAFLLGEAGGEDPEWVAGGIVSTVNLAEIVAVLHAGGNPLEDVRAIVGDLALTAVPPDEATAFDAGAMREHTRAVGLSLGDRFCLALARRLQAPVLTADRAWLKVAERVGVEVRVIR